MKSKLLIISYNEGEQDFEKEDIELLKKKIETTFRTKSGASSASS
jgi:hypothetical protein